MQLRLRCMKCDRFVTRREVSGDSGIPTPLGSWYEHANCGGIVEMVPDDGPLADVMALLEGTYTRAMEGGDPIVHS